MGTCIWCRKESSSHSLEHIIPEALGCPDGFHLKQGHVCKSCNNKLAHLDQAVLEEFDILAFMSGVRRKKKRLPGINSRGNLIGKYVNNNKTIFINMDSEPVKIEGHRVGGYGKSKRNIKATIEDDNIYRKISFQVIFGDNPKFVRGILKIAFSSLAYFIGTEEVLLSKYDGIRNFVRNNKGQRKILFRASKDISYRNQVWSPFVGNDGYAIVLRIGIIEFVVDLTPNMSLFPVIYEKAMQEFARELWWTLPVDKQA